MKPTMRIDRARRVERRDGREHAFSVAVPPLASASSGPAAPMEPPAAISTFEKVDPFQRHCWPDAPLVG
jgi:hypothetical protein